MQERFSGDNLIASDNFATVAERLLPGARLSAVRRLTGGVSADVHALELQDADGHRRTVVVRQHVEAEWKHRHEQVAAMEHELLQVLYRAELPVPEPLLLDTTAQLLPRSFLVMAFVEGSTDIPAHSLNTCLEIMASTLVRLHNLPRDILPILPSRTDPLPELFDYLPEIPEWRELREHLYGIIDSAYQGPPVLLHGDFWPGNLLWQNDQLQAILDWEDAAVGDPAADVAGCRLELLWKYGSGAMDHFTQAYAERRSFDIRRLALWEVFVGAAANHFMGKWGLEPSFEAEMRMNADYFVRQAGDRLLDENRTSG